MTEEKREMMNKLVRDVVRLHAEKDEAIARSDFETAAVRMDQMHASIGEAIGKLITK